MPWDVRLRLAEYQRSLYLVRALDQTKNTQVLQHESQHERQDNAKAKRVTR